MRTAYDPYNRDEERELERIAAARSEHEQWSFEQARIGQSATQRENAGTWVRTRLPIPEAAQS
jgi:hypothetical protein